MSAEAGWDVPQDAGDNANGGGRTPPSPARRSGRSRSPEARRPEMDDRRDDRMEQDRGRGAGQNNPGNNLHVSGLSTRVEESDLEDLFSKYGKVARVQIMRDPHTKDPRGFAFVNMSTPDEAEACIASLSATELMGKVITVDKARRGRARTPTPGTYHGPPKKGDFPGGPPPPRGGGGYGGGGRPRRYDPYEDDRYYDRRGPPPPRSYRDDPYYAPRDRSYAAPMRDERRADAAPPAPGYDDRYSSRGGGYDRYDDRDYRRERY